jgi:hypothetical protein
MGSIYAHLLLRVGRDNLPNSRVRKLGRGSRNISLPSPIVRIGVTVLAEEHPEHLILISFFNLLHALLRADNEAFRVRQCSGSLSIRRAATVPYPEGIQHGDAETEPGAQVTDILKVREEKSALDIDKINRPRITTDQIHLLNKIHA